MDNEPQKWRHPGGKLRELGAETLTDAELLSILIAPGISGKPAERIGEEIQRKLKRSSAAVCIPLPLK